MDDRLAQVRALVAERWRMARERRQRNDLYARRVEALERFVHSELLVTNATRTVEIAALEKEILTESAAEETSRIELATRERKRERIKTRVWTGQRQVEYLKDALKDHQIEMSATWAEMMSDRERLQEQDSARQEIERKAQHVDKQVVEQLQHQLMTLEKVIAAKKMESEKARRALENLKYRKRNLEGDLERAGAENISLTKKIAKLRGPKHAALVEEGIDAILRELDEMGAP